MVPRLDSIRITQEVARCREMSPDWLGFDCGWLASVGARVVAQESGTFLETETCAALASTLSQAGVTELVALTHDAQLPEQFGFVLRVDANEIEQGLTELFGLAFCVLPADRATPAILVTTADYRLVAGPEQFLRSYVGDLGAARNDFIAYAYHPVPQLDALLKRAAGYMDWIER